MNDAVYLGLDLGTSGLKGVAVHADGAVLARHGQRYPTARPVPGSSEQDTRHWQDAATATVRALADQLADSDRPRLHVRGVGLSAMIPTLVTTRTDLSPIGPAVTWEDNRAERDGAALRGTIGGHALYQATGQWLDGRYLLPMYLRIVRADPDRASDTRHLLAAKDFLLHWLTGHLATDPSTATGYGCYHLYAQRWIDDIRNVAADHAGGRLPNLPDITEADQWAPLRPDLANALSLPAGTPICIGGADSVLGALGMHATEAGDIAYVAGTSNVILGIYDGDPTPDRQHRYLITPLAGAPGWGYEMDLLATGSAIRWLAELTHTTETDLLALAADIPPDEAPLFLPFLSPGEQGARWMPQLTGVLTGLDLTHGAAHLARGLLSGIVAESRLCLAVLAEAGITGNIHIAGGASTSRTFRTDLANSTGRTVLYEPDSHTDYSAFGAAILAAHSTDKHTLEPQFGQQHLISPQTDATATWRARILRHEATLSTLFSTNPDNRRSE